MRFKTSVFLPPLHLVYFGMPDQKKVSHARRDFFFFCIVLDLIGFWSLGRYLFLQLVIWAVFDVEFNVPIAENLADSVDFLENFVFLCLWNWDL
jgi:hypothetical protein